MKKLLLTGFRGSSSEIFARESGCEFLILPNHKVKDAELLISAMQSGEYDLVLSLGQRPRLQNKVSVETFAGKGAEKIFTSADAERFLHLLKKHGVNAKISRGAGTSYCDSLYRNGLAYILKEKLQTEMLFLHIPFADKINDLSSFRAGILDAAEEYQSSEAAFVFPPPVTEALRRLRGAGYEAYAVGGCVRDLLRGAAPSDYDMTTSALPEQIRAVFKGEKTVDTGLKHGTLTVILSGMPLEITTYRLESAYSDHRHPDGVIFTDSLREDLARRDFTVNAMGATEDGQIADFFGGRRDLAARLLRCVGEPEKRFREDALRILRALRFVSGLGFGVERETLAAAERCAPLLAYVSAERIREELFGLLLGADAEKALSLGGKILRTVLPECFGEGGEPETGLCALLSRLPQDLILRLAALFYGEGERQDPVKTAEAVLTRLKTDGKTKKQVLSLLESRNLPLQSDGDLLIACGRLSPGGAERLLTLKSAAARARGEDGGLYEAGKRRLAALLAEGRCYRLRELALDGNALRLLGVPEGKAMGEMLAALLEGVIRGKYENTPDALAGAVREMLSEQ